MDETVIQVLVEKPVAVGVSDKCAYIYVIGQVTVCIVMIAFIIAAIVWYSHGA